MASSIVSSLRSKLRLQNMPSFWKLIAIFYVLINLKCLPFAWHLRLLHGLLTQIRTSRYRLAHCAGPATLFAPLITSSRTPILETDYNLHKSNSTYFIDSDVGRLHLMVALCGKGMDRVRDELDAADRALGLKSAGWGWWPSSSAKSRSFGVHLGGVSASFRKAIKPYEEFEVWTRILCWDRKWLYVVQHFVKKDGVKKGRSLLQPWRDRQRRIPQIEKEVDGEATKPSGPSNADGTAHKQSHPAIFASLIAKYVFKQGRLTISPERVLEAAELLPPKPSELGSPLPSKLEPSVDNAPAERLDATVTSMATTAMETLSPEKVEAVIDSSLEANYGDVSDWDWATIEKERSRGMQMAELFCKLDALNDHFPGDGAPILGHY